MANCLLMLTALAVTLFVCCESSYIEEKLQTELFSSYKKHVRPGRHHDDTVVVKFGLALINIGDVVREKEEIEFNYWGRFSWTDDRLQWDFKEYENITMTRVPCDWLWKPDMTVYSGVRDTDYFFLEHHHGAGPMATLHYSGEVNLIPPITTRVRCAFEPQEGNAFRCTMKFGSWTMSGFLMQLAHFQDEHQVNLDSYMDNIWNITDSSITKRTTYYPCCMEPYLHMEVNVTLSPMHDGN